MLFALIPLVHGASISGEIYDIELNKVTEAILEISTTPAQRIVVTDGSYNVELGQGTYTVYAKYNIGDEEFAAVEQIIVAEEGNYVYDLILFPDLSEDEEIINSVENDFDVDSAPLNGSPMSYPILVFIIALLICTLLYFAIKFIIDHYKRNRMRLEEMPTSELDEELEKMLAFIKKEKGRVTQRDLRNEFPLSEAKISLMITDLERHGKVQKIKKGRGNVILLK